MQSPYFAKTKSKRRPGPKSKKRKSGTGQHFGLDYLGFISRCSTLLMSSVAQATLLCPSFDVAQKMLEFYAIKGYHTEWKEPIQIVIQTVNPDGTIAKECLPFYDATMENVDAAFELLEIYLRELNISKADRVVFCCDGARSYWKRTGPLAKKLGIPIHHEVIDYTHAKQNLNKIIDKLPKKISAKAKLRITELWKTLLWEGNHKELKTDIKRYISYPKNRKEALNLKVTRKKFNNYFVKNSSRMQYANFKRLRLPTGSGCVESAIRRVINLRLKSPGSFWKLENAESMLFLRN